MLDRRYLDNANFIHKDGSVVKINDIAKRNNINIETLKDILDSLLKNGEAIYFIDENNFPTVKMR